jgi:VWFA-related protein
MFQRLFSLSGCFSALMCVALVSNRLVAQAPVGASQPQTPPASSEPSPAGPSATISVNARLVNLPVIVRDKKGAIIQNLSKADFSLVVDGHPQTIRYFDRDNDLPLTLGLLVDVSGSVRNALDEERTASESFLDQMMQEPGNRPPDKAFLIQFAHEAELLQGLTPSRPKLREALNELGTPPKDEAQDDQDNANSGSASGYGRGGRRGGSHGGTTLYDSIFLASDELMQKQQGRKALVVLTDGEDRGSKETLASAISAAQKSETVVYAMYFKGEEHGYGGGHSGGFGGGHGGGFPGGGYPGGGGGGRGGEQHVDGKKVLLQITDETGGRMFEVSGKQNFAAIYSQIAEELRSQYRLGFTPDAEGAEEGLHRVNLSIPKDKKLIVQTRDGYYTR